MDLQTNKLSEGTNVLFICHSDYVTLCQKVFEIIAYYLVPMYVSVQQNNGTHYAFFIDEAEGLK